MSLINIFKGPSKLFKKHVISFLLIRRHDLGIIEQRLRYIAVRPTSSMSKLRQKIWYLLDLPDYCDEIIILKSSDEGEIALTALCCGNDPQHPYILEVWPPDDRIQLLSTNNNNNISTLGVKEPLIKENQQNSIENVNENILQDGLGNSYYETQQNASGATDVLENNRFNNTLHVDHKASELSYKFSNTSLLFKMPRRNNTDNFTCILLKIQNDLSTLSNKLAQLENKINI